MVLRRPNELQGPTLASNNNIKMTNIVGRFYSGTMLDQDPIILGKSNKRWANFGPPSNYVSDFTFVQLYLSDANTFAQHLPYNTGAS